VAQCASWPEGLLTFVVVVDDDRNSATVNCIFCMPVNSWYEFTAKFCQ